MTKFSLRPFQVAALKSLQAHDHTILIASTGSGKSLVFEEYLAQNREFLRAILVSPLNALSRQIAAQLRVRGLNVALGAGVQSDPPPTRSGTWVISPEKLFSPYGERALKSFEPQFLIVDEAHCVSDWGDGFRPEFAKLPKLIAGTTIRKSLWCSATLTHETIHTLQSHAHGSVNMVGSFALPTMLEVVKIRSPLNHRMALLRVLLERHAKASGMIFVSTRAMAEKISFLLRHWGVESIFYHAGISAEERVAIEQKLSRVSHESGHRIWIVATSAFGMGMNYPFLKTCILFEPSFSLLALAQAIGRVTRAKDAAKAYVLWHEDDFIRHKRLLYQRENAIQQNERVKVWCQSSDSPKQNLEKFFNLPAISGKVEA